MRGPKHSHCSEERTQTQTVTVFGSSPHYSDSLCLGPLLTTVTVFGSSPHFSYCLCLGPLLTTVTLCFGSSLSLQWLSVFGSSPQYSDSLCWVHSSVQLLSVFGSSPQYSDSVFGSSPHYSGCLCLGPLITTVTVCVWVLSPLQWLSVVMRGPKHRQPL